VTTSLGFIVPVVIGSICLLTVCGVYLWKQSFKLEGLLLSISGVFLLWLSNSQPQSDEQAMSDLTRLFGEIREAWTGQEAQIAQIIRNQEQLVALLGAFNETHASTLTAHEAEPQTAAGVPATPPPDSLTIEAVGGVSNEELDTIVSWIQETKSERPASVILIEPIMPHESADLDGQRRRLMNEAGRVMDHVFEEISQTIEVTRLASDTVPGPMLRLHSEASSGWQMDRFRATNDDQTSSPPRSPPSAAVTGRKASSASLTPTQAAPTAGQTLAGPRPGARASREASQNAEQETDPEGKAELGGEGSVVITFAINSSYFPPGTRTALKSFVDRMTSGALYRVQLRAGLSGSDKVAGATTPEEAMRYNNWLADRRMNRVKEWLIDNARDRALEIKSEFSADDSARRVVVRALPASS
jgi:hypothetical protein